MKSHMHAYNDRKEIVKSLQTEVENWGALFIFYCTMLLCGGLLRIK